MMVRPDLHGKITRYVLDLEYGNELSSSVCIYVEPCLIIPPFIIMSPILSSGMTVLTVVAKYDFV